MVVPAQVPGAPSTVIAVAGPAGSGTATVTIANPVSDGGSPILQLTATTTAGGFSCSPPRGTNVCHLTGLQAGVNYYIRATATNAIGTSVATGTSWFVVQGPPAAPTAVHVTTSSGQATVSWTAPSNNGGFTISSYAVTSNPGNLGCTSTGTSCTVSGLTNGTTYTFTVIARNSSGAGVPSVPTSPVMPVGVPGLPLSLSATGGVGQATVSWAAPASNGGSSITGYTVTATPGGATCATTLTSCTITGLEKGSGYGFSVVAVNALGAGAASIDWNSTLVLGVPDQPTMVTAVPSDGQATVSWMAPANFGGSAVSNYVVTASDATSPGRNGDGATCSYQVGVPEVDQCVIAGLTDGDSYKFTVVATNAIGDSPASSASASVIPAAIPGAPTSVSATMGSASALVTWSAPSFSGGAPLSYLAESSPGGFSCTSTTTSCTITGLVQGTNYTFNVTASNDVGTSLAGESPQYTSVSVPAAPGVATVVLGNKQATISWPTPTNDGGLPITSYSVNAVDSWQLDQQSGTTCSYVVPTDGSTSLNTCTITGLIPGDYYWFAVSAINAVGAGAAGSSAFIEAATTPSAPWNPAAVAGNASATVSWSMPYTSGLPLNGGSPVTSYLVTASPGGATCTYQVPTDGSPESDQCTVNGLTNGTSYTFTVSATNVLGTGPGAKSAAVTPMTTPGAPTAVKGVGAGQTVTVAWTAPASNGGSAITGYVVTSSNGGGSCTSTSTSCQVGGLSEGSSYVFTVTASNTVGSSAATQSASFFDAYTVPAAPTNVVATTVWTIAGEQQQTTVTWTAPVDTGGKPITAYTVTSDGSMYICYSTTTSCTFPAFKAEMYSGISVRMHFTVTATNQVGTGPSSLASPGTTWYGYPPA